MPHWDGTITLGNVVTLLGVAVIMARHAISIETKVAILWADFLARTVDEHEREKRSA